MIYNNQIESLSSHSPSSSLSTQGKMGLKRVLKFFCRNKHLMHIFLKKTLGSGGGLQNPQFTHFCFLFLDYFNVFTAGSLFQKLFCYSYVPLLVCSSSAKLIPAGSTKSRHPCFFKQAY